MGPTEFRHGRRIGLDALFVRLPGAPTHVIDTGLDLTGEAPGRLHGWFPTVKGDWLGVVEYEIRYADGRREQVQPVNQLVPAYALRPHGEGEHGFSGTGS